MGPRAGLDAVVRRKIPSPWIMHFLTFILDDYDVSFCVSLPHEDVNFYVSNEHV
jgi:hypothetical protein